MLLLFSLIFRAIAIEFRSKQPMKWWRQTWDMSFSLASIMASLVLGVAVGNIIQGIPIDAEKNYTGTFFDLFTPFTLLVGVTTVALFMMHGAIYLVMKTEGEFHDKIRGWVNNCIIFFIMCYGMTTVYTLIYLPGMAEKFRQEPVLFVIPLINMFAIANVPREMHYRRNFLAFLSSCLAVMALIMLFGMGIFPNIVTSTISPDYNLTIYNASASVKALNIMFNIALLGMPFVLAYTFCIYWIFRGKVKISKDSY
jgi:cytochrome d ubiquinol oxidase subunit II